MEDIRHMEDTRYMNVKIEEIEKNKLVLEIELGADILEDGLEKAYKRIAKRFNVPGFRKGRAPRSMVERHFGAAVLYEGAIDALCPEYYDKAISENNLFPIDAPELELVEIEKGKPFIFKATVTVKPQIEIGRYIGVEAAYKPALVTDDDIDKALKAAADKNARLITPEEDRPVKEGDIVLIDYEGSVDGVPFEGGKAAGQSLEIGSHTFIPGFEEQLVGKNAGESFQINVRFPDDYQHSGLNGRDTVFDITIHSIKEKELPAIDDDFAQDVSEFDTLEEYRADIRKKLTEKQEGESLKAFQEELMQKIIDDSAMDIPEIMIKKQIERDIKEFEMSLSYSGLNLEKYMELYSMTRESLEDSMRERAVREISTQLAFEQIEKAEAIEVTDEDYDYEIAKRAEVYKKEFADYKASISDDLEKYIRAGLKRQKAIDFVTEKAVRI